MSSRWLLPLAVIWSTSAHANIDEFTNKTLHIKTGVQVPGYDLLFKEKESGREVKFSPNLMALYTVSASVQGLVGAGYGFRTTQSEKDRTQRGPTDYQDWRFSFAFRRFHLSLAYSQMQGFFVEDTGAIQPSWTSGQPYYQAPNLKAENTVANLTWIFSPDDFSLEAALDQTTRQNSSGGSFLAGIALSQTRFSDTTAIIPSALQGSFREQATLQEGRFLSAALKAGYGYGLVFATKYFLSGALQVGFGPQQTRFRTANDNFSRFQTAGKVDLTASLGYNGDENYAGFSVMADAFTYPTGEMDITSTLYVVSLFYGFRL